MTVEPPPDFREEVDIVRIDPLFLERQRNRYASRGVAFLVILNGVAAHLSALLRLRVRLSAIWVLWLRLETGHQHRYRTWLGLGLLALPAWG